MHHLLYSNFLLLNPLLKPFLLIFIPSLQFLNIFNNLRTTFIEVMFIEVYASSSLNLASLPKACPARGALHQLELTVPDIMLLKRLQARKSFLGAILVLTPQAHAIRILCCLSTFGCFPKGEM